MAELNDAQRWSLVLSRHISGSLSVAASSVIVYQIGLRYIAAKKRSTSTSSSTGFVSSYHRLMLGFSIADILYSFWVGLSSLAVPASSGVIYGLGNTLTCSTQGFFMQFSVATHLYMAALSTHFLLKIRYNLSDDVLYRRCEFWFHFIPWFIAIATGAIGLVFTVFNAMLLPELGCWLGPFPITCLFPGGPECIRGYKIKKLAMFYPFFFAYIWMFASFFVILVNNVLIYQAIRHQERRNAQYLAVKLQLDAVINASNGRRALGLPFDVKKGSTAVLDSGDSTKESYNQADADGTSTSDNAGETSSSSRPTDVQSEATDDSPAVGALPPTEGAAQRTTGLQIKAKASRVAATQSVLYVSTAFLTAIWVFMPFLTIKLGLSHNWRFFFSFMCCAFAPLQGLFNMLIFVRLDYLRLRSKNQSWGRFKCAKKCLLFPELK